MARNTFARRWIEIIGGRRLRRTVEGVAWAAQTYWRDVARDAAEADSLGRAALRVRWGARAACRRLRAALAEARQRADNLEGMAFNLDKENADLQRKAQLAAHVFHANGGGAIIRELKDVRALLGMADTDGMTPVVAQKALEERDASRRELRALEWLIERGWLRLHGTEHAGKTWHEAALNCGMKETDDG